MRDGEPTERSSAGNAEGFESSQRTLVLRAMDGDLRAFEALVDQYQRPLRSFCHRMVRDAQEAEDIVQDTFLTVWRRFDTLHDPARFKAWIYRLASNACVDLIRKRETRRSVPTDSSDLQDFADLGVSPERNAEVSEAVRALEQVLAQLPPEQKLAWVLFEMQGESYAQIADILKVTENSVRGRIHRARMSIVQGMEGWL
ncbi:RNA polymerase sigma factor [Nesterenkonia muleiensis]|uniref:RNA polymerase sigma factor n=1 Tax=Nesterenkonia muleiensis TaxID=2282648 RepID=UPI000E75B9F1|nr:RNA polymerase sigma factor [Nesterenkonia muleiensis]